MDYDFDLFVIGGGSGGVRAARLAAQKGLKVAMAEGDRMGGTCVIRGCVPKKLMLMASDFSHELELGRGFGWDIPTSQFQWSKFHKKLTTELERLEGVYEGIMERNHVRLFKDWAELDGPNQIALSSGLKFSAERILIATGGKPFVPQFEGYEHAITSNDIFHMERLPETILIKGGGYIACEFASILNQMGVNVTLIYRGDKVLRGYDEEIRDIISSRMEQNGITIHYGVNLEMLALADTGKKVAKLDNGMELAFDEVLVATGRVPNVEGLNLETVGIALEKGAIAVDEFSQTNIASIYAIGDVTGRVSLTPVAIREAVNFVSTVYENTPASVNYKLIPTAVFTRPELGTVGLSEEAAKAEGFEVDIYATEFKMMRPSFAGAVGEMFMKIVVDTKSTRVLGVHIIGEGSGEMIQLVGIAVTMGATKAQFDQTIAIHPTAAEELVTLKTKRET